MAGRRNAHLRARERGFDLRDSLPAALRSAAVTVTEPAAVLEALRLAGGDRRRLRVRTPPPGVLAEVMVLNRART